MNLDIETNNTEKSLKAILKDLSHSKKKADKGTLYFVVFASTFSFF
jgi:hypothetical protein